MSKVENLAQGTPCWVDLSTSDIESAKSFYSSLFGWKYNANAMGPEMTYYMANVNDGNVAGLAQQMPEMGNMPPAWGVYLTVNSVDTVAEKVPGAGGSIVFPPDDVPNAGRICVASDPSGAMIGFWEPKGHQGFEVVNEPGTVIWTELLVDDVQSVLPFYKNVVGVDTVTEPFPGMGEYTQFMVNGKGVAGAMKKPMTEAPNAWLVYFQVTDTDKTVAQTQELGGKVIAPAFDIQDIGRAAVLSDPQGAVFCVLQPSPNMASM